MDRIFCGNFGFADYITVDTDSGVIKSMGSGIPCRTPDVLFSAEEILLPGDFNAHSHPEQSLYVEIADKNWELSKWCRETIYKYSTSMTPELVYWACIRSFGRMLSFGVTSVMVSYYCHNRQGNQLDRAVIKAARDTGIRIYFGRMNYDIITEGAYKEKHDSQLSYYETPEMAEKNFVLLLGEETSTVNIAPALHSFHANTLRAVIHGINLGSEYNRKVQFHLSEDEGDVVLCLEKYGKRPVEVLEQLVKTGEISKLDHVVLSDCVWTSEHEKELIKELNMSVVINGRMNERVKAGRADVKKYLEMGIPFYVGTDGEASNEDLSINNERNWLIKHYGLSEYEAKLLEQPFEMCGAKVGSLEVGDMADIRVLKDGKIEALYVGGNMVMQSGVHVSQGLLEEAEEYIKKIWQDRKN